MITESDILKIYKTSLFGNESEPVKAAAMRAYRDFCRTIDFKEKSYHSKAVEKVVSVILLSLTKFVKNRQRQCNFNKVYPNARIVTGTISQASGD